ncbi:MAG: SMP-30/gluconolactonase/LRE family protein [Pseudomonadales bacterium]
MYDLKSEQLEWLARPELDSPGNRFNDGRVDRQGRFWAGAMVEDKAIRTRAAGLYRLDNNRQCRGVVDGISISNGLCWSPDSRVMYHADSPRRQMYAYDFDASSGTASNKRVFTSTEDGFYPDGATVDSEGYLFSAQWGGSRIVRYTPSGDIDGVLNVPVSQPSCMAFGGENLDLLFVTTARENLDDESLSEQPMAGNVLIYQTPFKGTSDPVVKALN